MWPPINQQQRGRRTAARSAAFENSTGSSRGRGRRESRGRSNSKAANADADRNGGLTLKLKRSRKKQARATAVAAGSDGDESSGGEKEDGSKLQGKDGSHGEKHAGHSYRLQLLHLPLTCYWPMPLSAS
jgi:hypothetical protein